VGCAVICGVERAKDSFERQTNVALTATRALIEAHIKK